MLAYTTIARLLLAATVVSATPFSPRADAATNVLEARADATPVIDANFPDPFIFYNVPDSTFYAFATNNGNGIRVQTASASSASGPWTVLGEDALPDVGDWVYSTSAAVWAPAVLQVADGSYVLYYSATTAESTAHHCVGTATSDTILGPYTPAATAFACPLSQGGAIDPAPFIDTDGTYWVTYKIDGNSIGNGGSCGNTVAPIVSTPIMIQQVETDGVTLIGSAIELLDRGDADGPLIEAPSLVHYDGVYFLFFSSNCYSTTLYDISYAYASSVTGTYTKASAPLLVTGDYGLTAPGSATARQSGGTFVFHANCDPGRCMYERSFTVSGNTITT